jgi:voltage-gated potassium channel Kch
MTQVAAQSFLLIGESNLARHMTALLARDGHTTTVLTTPDDATLQGALQAETYDGIAVVTHDDVAALRYALSAAHYVPHIPVVVTMFDHTVAARLRAVLPHCVATSPADIAAPVLAGACLGENFLAITSAGQGVEAVMADDCGATRTVLQGLSSRSRLQAALAYATGLLRTHDRGTRMLLSGLLGVVAIILADWAWLVLAKHHDPSTGLLEAVRVVTTVGPAVEGHGLYAVVSAAAMMVTVLLTAMVTAGFVDRILSPRLVGLIGPRVLPRSGHVIVIGLGQVGLRLCRELVDLGIDVVGVERNPAAPSLRLVRALRIPAVVVGHGEDRRLLERLGAHRARAVAVVGSDDLDNIAAAIAAQAVAPDTRIVLRAGEHATFAETRTLLPLGIVRNVALLSAAYVVARLTGQQPVSVAANGRHVWTESPSGAFTKVVCDNMIADPVPR